MKNCLSRMLAAVACCMAATAWAAPCPGTLDRNAAVLSNGFAGNPANTRNAASPLDSGNVASLQLALTHVADGTTEKRGAPAVTSQALFFSAGRELVAMDRIQGCRYWTYTVPRRHRPLIGGNALRSSAIYYLNADPRRPPLVLAGDTFGNFYAVHALSGALLWSRFLGTEPDHHMITGGAQYHAGKLLVPISTHEVISTVVELLRPCCSSHGMLRALDPYTGEEFWTYHTAPEATYQRSTGKLGPNGMSIWATPAIDAARGTVYVGTGQNLTPPITSNSDAIVALDLETGREKWVFQSTPDDAWNAGCDMPPLLRADCVEPEGYDFDFGAAPILAALPGGGDTLIAGAKNGVVYSLDPDSGALRWQRKLGRGGTLGGIHWGMAVDAQRVYAAVSDVTVNKVSGLNLGNLVGGSSEITPVEGATPGIYALDLRSGALVWDIHPQHEYAGRTYDSIYSAALTVTNDLLFAGSLDGRLRAFRTSDGAQRWVYDTVRDYTDAEGNTGNGGTIDSVGAIVAGGDLLLNSGYDTFGGSNELQAGPGNVLLVFRLPGQ